MLGKLTVYRRKNTVLNMKKQNNMNAYSLFSTLFHQDVTKTSYTAKAKPDPQDRQIEYIIWVLKQTYDANFFYDTCLMRALIVYKPRGKTKQEQIYIRCCRSIWKNWIIALTFFMEDVLANKVPLTCPEENII